MDAPPPRSRRRYRAHSDTGSWRRRSRHLYRASWGSPMPTSGAFMRRWRATGGGIPMCISPSVSGKTRDGHRRHRNTSAQHVNPESPDLQSSAVALRGAAGLERYAQRRTRSGRIGRTGQCPLLRWRPSAQRAAAVSLLPQRSRCGRISVQVRTALPLFSGHGSRLQPLARSLWDQREHLRRSAGDSADHGPGACRQLERTVTDSETPAQSVAKCGSLVLFERLAERAGWTNSGR